MVKVNCSSRLLTIEVILTQTDTTVGFLSQSETKLKEIKSRQSNKPFIRVYENFEALLKNGIRIPSSQKNKVRRARKTTFIVKNISFRVAKNPLNSSVFRSLSWSFSTSANEAGKRFDRKFCEEKADIIVENKNSLHEGIASSLYKINSKKTKRLR